MRTAGYLATLRDIYLNRFGPLLYLSPIFEPPSRAALAAYRERERAGLNDGEVRLPTNRELREVEKWFSSLDVRDVHVGDMGPPWNIHALKLREEEEEEEDEEPYMPRHAFDELTFGPLTTADPRVVLASYGAAKRAGHEVFVTAAAPWPGYTEMLLDVVLQGPSPGKILPAATWGTPFRKALLAPAGAGAISLGAVDGVERFALKVIPLTNAEAELGSRSVDRLLGALEGAGALQTSDVLRDCVVAPEVSRQYWAAHRATLLGYFADKLKYRLKVMKRQIVARAPGFLREEQRYLVHNARLILSQLQIPRLESASRILH